MHGYLPGEVVPATELLLSHKHPDDRCYVAQTLNAIRTSGEPFSSRHRIVDMKGVTRSVIVVDDSIMDESGTVTGSSGFYIDVTETLDRTVKESVDEVVDEINSSRGAIEQAKGMLMIVYGISAGPRLRHPHLVLPAEKRQTPPGGRAIDRPISHRLRPTLRAALAIRPSANQHLTQEESGPPTPIGACG
ncbi:PAS domain-containing protein [Rhodococcus sp. IEGM 1318]|uniref:PAS domain-containing protein n=1 Tax=Rhodococcus sp. IEGM 1318 TaxID=3082226 RepID=UPI0029559963|nr:PAS domain-containing protein [Rhodococcus sp. IEGM 1318]MDV8009449.1 PAS domain-containing protein [Rhodococcus sp. IEGM 1318]